MSHAADEGTPGRPEPTVPLAFLPRGPVTPALEPAELSELDAPDFSDVLGDGPPPEVEGPADVDAEAELDPRRPRRRRRYVSGFFIAVLLLTMLAVLALVGDNLARLQAERTIAAQLTTQLGPAARTSVAIDGTPFVTQLASHHFERGRLKVTNARLDGIDVPRLDVTATGLRTSPDNKTGTIDALDGDAVLSYASLGAKQNVTLDYVSGTSLRATMNVKILGHAFKVYVTGRPVLDEAAQTVLLTDLHTEIEKVALPDIVVREAAKVILRPIAVPLPAGMKVTSITLLPEGLDAHVKGSHVDLAALR